MIRPLLSGLALSGLLLLADLVAGQVSSQTTASVPTMRALLSEVSNTDTRAFIPDPTVAGQLAQRNAQPTTSLAAMERAVHTQVNQYRAKKGLPALTLNPQISEQARLHSQAMANGRVPFSHQGFEQRAKVIGRTLAYRRFAENVAYNQGYRDPGQQAVQGWIKSPGHRKNMEGTFNLTGIGIAQNSKGEYYFTQLFLQQR